MQERDGGSGSGGCRGQKDSGVAVVINLIQVGASSERAALVEEEEEGCQSVGIRREAGEGGGVRAAAALHSAAGRHSVATLSHSGWQGLQ